MNESRQKYYCHPSALVEASQNSIGKDTRIWAFVHILPGAVIGSECNICDHVFIENDVVIGDRVTVKSGVQLWDGITVEDDVFIGPNATFTNEKFPLSKYYMKAFEKTVIKQRASIGANATILPGVIIEAGAIVHEGAVVTQNVPTKAIVVGNPAKIVGYANTVEKPASVAEVGDPIEKSKINGVLLQRLKHVQDLRGNLSAIEWEKELSFNPKRIFFVYDVPNGEVRGEHSHKVCHQFLICIQGSIAVVVDDGENREEFFLNERQIGIHIPPGVWGIQYKYSRDAVLVVLASHEYDPDDYIREYDEFLNWKKL